MVLNTMTSPIPSHHVMVPTPHGSFPAMGGMSAAHGVSPSPSPMSHHKSLQAQVLTNHAQLERNLSSAMLEHALRLSSLIDADVFILIETPGALGPGSGQRLWAGKRRLRQSFLERTLIPQDGDLEFVTNPSHGSPHPGGASHPLPPPFPSPVASSERDAHPPHRPPAFTPTSASTAAATLISMMTDGHAATAAAARNAAAAVTAQNRHPSPVSRSHNFAGGLYNKKASKTPPGGSISSRFGGGSMAPPLDPPILQAHPAAAFPPWGRIASPEEFPIPPMSIAAAAVLSSGAASNPSPIETDIKPKHNHHRRKSVKTQRYGGRPRDSDNVTVKLEEHEVNIETPVKEEQSKSNVDEKSFSSKTDDSKEDTKPKESHDEAMDEDDEDGQLVIAEDAEPQQQHPRPPQKSEELRTCDDGSSLEPGATDDGSESRDESQEPSFFGEGHREDGEVQDEMPSPVAPEFEEGEAEDIVVLAIDEENPGQQPAVVTEAKFEHPPPPSFEASGTVPRNAGESSQGSPAAAFPPPASITNRQHYATEAWIKAQERLRQQQQMQQERIGLKQKRDHILQAFKASKAARKMAPSASGGHHSRAPLWHKPGSGKSAGQQTVNGSAAGNPTNRFQGAAASKRKQDSQKSYPPIIGNPGSSPHSLDYLQNFELPKSTAYFEDVPKNQSGGVEVPSPPPFAFSPSKPPPPPSLSPYPSNDNPMVPLPPGAVPPPPPNLFPHPNYSPSSVGDHRAPSFVSDSDVVFPSASTALIPHHGPTLFTNAAVGLHPDFLRGEFGDFAPTTTAGVLSAAAASGANFQNAAKKKKKKTASKSPGESGAGCGVSSISDKDQARKERHRMYMRKWREKRKSEGLALY